MTKEQLEDEFFSEKLYHSYSSLSKLLYSPALFYKEYVLKERETVTSRHLIEGKLIHSLMLDKANFDDLFIIAPDGLPSDNTLKVIEHVWEIHRNPETIEDLDNTKMLSDYSQEILDKLAEMELHQSLKTDEQRLAKIINPVTEKYWYFLKNKEGRDIVDFEMLDKCTAYKDALMQNEEAVRLLTTGDEIYNEHGLVAELDDLHMGIPVVGIKGLLDNLTIDHTHCVITINDLKTTNKTVSEFPESVEFWKYWLQMGIYTLLVSDNYKKLLQQGYTLRQNFIVIDLYKQVYCYEVSLPTMQKWVADTLDAIRKASWHFNNQNYTLPYEFLTQKVVL